MCRPTTVCRELNGKQLKGLLLNEYSGAIFEKNGRIIGYASFIMNVVSNSFIYQLVGSEKWYNYEN